MKKRFCALIAALVCAFCLAGAALAAELPSIPEGSNYVFDPDNVIIDTYDPQLDEQAAHITADYACGVYILAVRDFTSYGYGMDDIQTFAEDFYLENDLGYGEDRDGVLLAFSEDTRDICLISYGDFGNAAFTDYGKDTLWDTILPYFRDNDRVNGFINYLAFCENLLSQAQSGTPVNVPGSYQEPFNLPKALGSAAAMCFLPAAIIAFVICGAMKKKMKTARKASGAEAYVSGSVDLKVRTDRYTHSTVLRTPLKQDNGPRSGGRSGFRGGTTVNSRGFSGSSRKF